jgi:ABC-type phosphate transport system permease subunit
MTASRHLGEGVAVALVSGPFFVLLCNLMDKAEEASA